MENLSQNELINTIVNLSKKVEELKVQNGHLREIRLQLASLAINNNYGTDTVNVDKSTSRSFGKRALSKIEDTVNSHSMSDELNSNSNPLISDHRHNVKNNHCQFAYELFDQIITEDAFGGSAMKSKVPKLHFCEPSCETELYTKLKTIRLFVDLFDNIIHYCSCYLNICEIVYVASYFCESFENSILCVHIHYTPIVMGFIIRISKSIITIPTICFEQSQMCTDLENNEEKKINQLKCESCVKYVKWCSQERFLLNINSVSFKIVPEQSFLSDHSTDFFQEDKVRSYLGYLLTFNWNTNLRIHKSSYLLSKPLTPQRRKLNYSGKSEYQDKCVKSYSLSIAKCPKIKPPVKLVINSISNIPKKVSSNKQKPSPKRTNSLSIIKVKDSDFSRKSVLGEFTDNSSFSSSIRNHGSRAVLLTYSRKLWHEKCKICFAILFSSTVSEIIVYSGFTISMSPNNLFEFNYENIRNITQEFMDRKKNQIIQSQLKEPLNDSVLNEVVPQPICKDDYIKLNSIDKFESVFSKYEFQDRYFPNQKNIYDMKSMIKSNVTLNMNHPHIHSMTNSSGLSPFYVQELLENNPETFNKRSHIRKNKFNITDSITDSSSTLVQKSNLYTYHDAINDELSSRNCDSLIFTNHDQDVSIMNTSSDQSFESEIMKCQDRLPDLRNKSISTKRVKVEDHQSIQSSIQEKSRHLTSYPRKSRLSQRRSSFISLRENSQSNKVTQSHRELQDHRNKIKLSFLKHLIEMSKGNDISKINSLRKKAASYILNSKLSYNNWQKESNSGTCAQMKHFLDKDVQSMISNKHYKCDKCSLSFKLGIELRQHLRTHNFRTKSIAI